MGDHDRSARAEFSFDGNTNRNSDDLLWRDHKFLSLAKNMTRTRQSIAVTSKMTDLTSRGNDTVDYTDLSHGNVQSSQRSHLQDTLKETYRSDLSSSTMPQHYDNLDLLRCSKKTQRVL